MRALVLTLLAKQSGGDVAGLELSVETAASARGQTTYTKHFDGLLQLPPCTTPHRSTRGTKA